MGGGTRAREGGSKGFGAGGVGEFRNLRCIFDVSNAYKKKEKLFF